MKKRQSFAIGGEEPELKPPTMDKIIIYMNNDADALTVQTVFEKVRSSALA
jgi:hypothetical protein